jgi:F-type H+-transporting ATPase subunit gamma
VASTEGLKLRIRSVKKTKQITKAMQLVAASKMRRAQEVSKASAPYAFAARQLLTSISRHYATKEHPLFAIRAVKKRLVVVIASDKGLAGSYNSNIFKMYANHLQSDKKGGIKNETITIGRKAAVFASRLKDNVVLASYEYMPDNPDVKVIKSILEIVYKKFIAKEIDAVDLIFTEFISGVKQEAKTLRLLPVGVGDNTAETKVSDAIYEPSAEALLDAVVYRLVEAQVFHTLLEARASEHVMRMVAMKNATDNADDLTEDLTLAMNKARQGAITQEIAEISGGAEAISAS